MKKPLTRAGVERMRKREAAAGLDPADEAANWLAEHDSKPAPPESKSKFKSKTLHNWKRRQA